MNRGMTLEYLKCRADLNFQVDFGVNGAIWYEVDQVRVVPMIWQGGQEIFFPDFKICMPLRGMLPRENTFKWCVLVCIWIRFCLQEIKKISIF